MAAPRKRQTKFGFSFGLHAPFSGINGGKAAAEMFLILKFNYLNFVARDVAPQRRAPFQYDCLRVLSALFLLCNSRIS